MEATVEKITPDVAKRWLEKNINNRHVSVDSINHYTGIMQRGEWVINGDSIRFCEDGRLMDGQHRLEAIVKSGTVLEEAVIVRGLPEEAFNTIDVGKHRTISDILSIAGQVNCNVLGGAILVAQSHAAGNFKSAGHPRKGITHKQILDTLEKNPKITESVKFSVGLKNSNIIGQGLSAGLHYLFSMKSSEDARTFFSKVAQGWGLGEDDPILVLRNKLIDIRMSKLKYNRQYLIVIIIKAWNAFRSGNKIKNLSWDHLNEEIPEIM